MTTPAELLTQYDHGTCENCGGFIYHGPFLRYEPDLDERSSRHLWRHRDGYATCGNMTTVAAPRTRPTVTTLCGSTRFRDDFFDAQRRLTLEGRIVISVGLFGHLEGIDIGTAEEPSETKVMLDELHKRKIDLSDGIFVVNPGGYVGTSTRGEIDYALAHGKKVEWLVCPNDTDGDGDCASCARRPGGCVMRS